MRYWEFHRHYKGRENWSTKTYIERIFECFDIGEEFIQCVLLRIEDKVLGQLVVDSLHFLAHSDEYVALITSFPSKIAHDF